MTLLEWLKFWSKSYSLPPILKYRIPPQMKIVRESKSESFRIPPQNENCHRVQLREFQNTPPPPPAKLKIVREFKSKSFRIPPPKIKNVRESKSESFRIPPPPPQRKLSESPSPRVSEYPRQTENYQRVQVQEFQNTPSQNKKCQGVQI